MQRRAYLATLGSAGLLGLAGCTVVGDISGDILDNSGDYDIGMTRNEFVPDRYEVSVGETVVWENTSAATHTVTAYEEALPEGAEFFASGGFETQEEADEAWYDDRGGGFDRPETYEHTFEIAGTYPYYCIPHEMDGRGTGRMQGEIRVVE